MTAPPAMMPNRKGAYIREMFTMYCCCKPWVSFTMMEKIMVVAPTTAVPINTGLEVALNVLPAPSFSSRQHRLGGRLERVARAIVLFQVVLGFLELRGEAVGLLDLGGDIGQRFDGGKLVHGLGVIRDGAVAIDGDGHRSHAEKAESHQAGDAVGFQAASRGTDRIARVVARAIGDDAGIAHVVFLDLEHDLHQVRTDIGDLGEDAAGHAERRRRRFGWQAEPRAAVVKRLVWKCARVLRISGYKILKRIAMAIQIIHNLFGAFRMKAPRSSKRKSWKGRPTCSVCPAAGRWRRTCDFATAAAPL